MGLTGLLSVLFFCLAVVAVCWVAFWLIGKLGLAQPAQKIALVIIVLIGLAALAYRFAGNIIPR